MATSQLDPPDWYKSLQDTVVAESILARIVAGAEIHRPRRAENETTPRKDGGRLSERLGL